MSEEGAVRRGTGPALPGWIFDRIEETEANAADSAPNEGEPVDPATQAMRIYVLHECQAKRDRIFKIAELDHKPPEVSLIDLYKLEAAAWSNHPDFPDKWRL